MLIGTEDLGVFVFSDEGDSLGSKNEGLTNLNIQALTLDNNGYVYTGTENGVWRRPLSEIVTSVDDEPTQPTAFILEQNYPNPFNPSTVIRYQLPVSGDVTLKVYDILGNEVATLVNEYKTAGKYEVEFSIYSDKGQNLSSGIYFYKLQTGEYTAVNKMVLLR
ncbi:MAG: T9SS type A sorting domain-containing protein [Ignavibacteriaceae bacterium]|nr:T9SS type A sorting domain-containing protein [Ignavibacteriaceae bacterium]